MQNASSTDDYIISQYLKKHVRCNNLKRPEIDGKELPADTVLVFKSLEKINNQNVQNSIFLNKD